MVLAYLQNYWLLVRLLGLTSAGLHYLSCGIVRPDVVGAPSVPGAEVEQGQLIDLRLTHQDIADLLGLTRVTVTRVLNDLEKQGIIRRRRRQALILHNQPLILQYEI